MKEEKDKLLYGDLSYKVMGVVFDVYNTIGSCHNEKYIQKAIATDLDALKIKYQREAAVPLIYKDKQIGKYYLDFIIEGKLILEIKRGGRLIQKDFEQIKAYLKMLDLKLGILILFSDTKVRFSRVLNIY
ncbi:MAG: GxxExxY protein [Patescibacteria group bacterium]